MIRQPWNQPSPRCASAAVVTMATPASAAIIHFAFIEIPPPRFEAVRSTGTGPQSFPADVPLIAALQLQAAKRCRPACLKLGDRPRKVRSARLGRMETCEGV